MKATMFKNLFDLFFPNVCIICGESLVGNEQQICLSCLHEIPKTNFHLQKDNPIEKKFWGKVNIYRGTSFFFFQKGSPFQKLLHALKYKGNKEIGEILGKYAAADLYESVDFKTVDVIIPVPLHPQKYKKRGYNQSEWIAKGLSAVLNVPIDTDSLQRLKENTTQTKKSVFERYENTEGIFNVVIDSKLKECHILLVDDVLTTGSTLEACVQVLSQISEVRISVFTLAVA